jgi:hypothetical protein
MRPCRCGYGVVIWVSPEIKRSADVRLVLNTCPQLATSNSCLPGGYARCQGDKSVDPLALGRRDDTRDRIRTEQPSQTAPPGEMKRRLRVPGKITEAMDAALGKKDQAATAPKRSSYFFGSPKHIPRSAARAGTPELRIDLDVGLTRRPVKGPANADQAEGRTLRGASYGR